MSDEQQAVDEPQEQTVLCRRCMEAQADVDATGWAWCRNPQCNHAWTI